MELLPETAPRADGWRSLLKPGQSLRHDLGQRQIQCPQHGAYTSTGTRYFQRTVVWTPCPECEKERLAAKNFCFLNMTEKCNRILSTTVRRM